MQAVHLQVLTLTEHMCDELTDRLHIPKGEFFFLFTCLPGGLSPEGAGVKPDANEADGQRDIQF